VAQKHSKLFNNSSGHMRHIAAKVSQQLKYESYKDERGPMKNCYNKCIFNYLLVTI